MTIGVILNILSYEEIKNETSFSEENEEEIPIVTKRDIHELKSKQTLYWISPYLSLSIIDIHEF